jgi:peptide/nickel transport system substrate-binding protein
MSARRTMATRRPSALSVLLVLVMVFVLAACSTPTVAPTPVAPAPTTAPTKAAPAPTAAAAPKRGGTMYIALWQTFPTLNFFMSTTTSMQEVLALVVEGLLAVAPDGTYIPVLAKEVPTTANGGVSADGKTITYKLKDGLLWSDGKKLTCEDVNFTWQAIMTPGTGVASTTGYSSITSVDCPDPLTVVVKYKELYTPFLSRFDAILPISAGDPKTMKNWAYNQKPIGSGPFKIDEYVSDDHVTLSRNDNYRDAKAGQPYLDKIVMRIVPSLDVAMQLLASGEVDVLWNPSTDKIPALEKMAGVKFTNPPRLGGERLYLNMAENKDGSDPTIPHQILGDVKVRQAIAFAINKQRIVDQLLFGKVGVGTSELNTGPFACDTKGYAYDMAQAKKLLDDAGWVPGADGMRVAKGAKYAPDGTKLRLKYSTTTGDKLREDTQLLVVQDLRAIGIDAYIENMPSAVLLGTWDAAAPRKRGNFDINQWSSNASLDPHSQMDGLWASSQIPTPKNTGGTNYSRFSDPKADAALKAAAGEVDVAKRRVLYCQLTQMAYDQANMIYLYQTTRMHAYRDRVQGWVANSWYVMTWNAADWWLK